MERLQSKLTATESENSELKGQVTSREEEIGRLSQERDELRELSERSSTELRTALEVPCVHVHVQCTYLYTLYNYRVQCSKNYN